MEKRVDDIEIVQQKVSDLLLTKYAIDELMAKKIAQNSIESIDKYKADLECSVSSFEIDKRIN